MNAGHRPATSGEFELLAGIAEVVITPEAGAPLLGTIQRSTGIHDDLFARALVLTAQAQRVVLICADLIGMDFALADEIRAGIYARTGISTALINCSHTHSAPFTIPWSVLGFRWLHTQGKPWRDGLVTKLSKLVMDALASSVPVTLRVGRAPVQIGSNRRLPGKHGVVMKPNPDGVVVPWVDVLCFNRTDCTPLAILFSHPAHPVIIHGSSRLISAEFPGFAVQRLKRILGGDVIPMYAQGCAGNINADPLRGGMTAAEDAGDQLADAVCQAVASAKVVSANLLELASLRIELPLLPLPSRDACARSIENAQARLIQRCGCEALSDDLLWKSQDAHEISRDHSDDVQPMENQPWWLADNLLCLRDLMKKIECADERPLRFDASMLRLGDDWCLLATSHELFAEYQHWFESSGPCKHKMMWAYTNGCESYIPTDEALAGGKGYEACTFPSVTGASLKYPYRRAVRPGVEKQLIAHLSSLWKT